jgi:hypothetical protein
MYHLLFVKGGGEKGARLAVVLIKLGKTRGAGEHSLSIGYGHRGQDLFPITDPAKLLYDQVDSIYCTRFPCLGAAITLFVPHTALNNERQGWPDVQCT